MQSLSSIRTAVDALPVTGRGRRFPAPLKAAITRYVIAARSRGVRTATLSDELSISWETLRRWTTEAVPPAPVAVRVVPEPQVGAALVSPTGWRLEGLSIADVRALVGP